MREPLSLKEGIIPKDYQREIVDDLIKHFKTKQYGAILKLDTGAGKTFIAINTIMKMRLRCLIIVQRIFMTKQWKNDILKFVNVDESKISILRDKEKTNFETFIFIGIVHSMIRYDDEWFKTIDYIILDEIHNIPCEIFMKILPKITHARYILGLSATPKDRRDGAHFITEQFVGPVIIDKEINLYEGDFTPVVKFIHFEKSLFENFQVKKNKMGKIDYVSCENQLNCINANTLIAKMILTLLLTTNRIILISCVRISQTDSIYCIINQLINRIVKEKTATIILNNENPEIIKKCKLLKKNCKTLITTYYSKNAKKIQDIKIFRAIIATQEMVCEAFDCPLIDTLIMVKSVSNIKILKQLTGRILRMKKLTSEINIPLIFNISYRFFPFTNHKLFCHDYYVKKKFIIVTNGDNDYYHEKIDWESIM